MPRPHAPVKVDSRMPPENRVGKVARGEKLMACLCCFQTGNARPERITPYAPLPHCSARSPSQLGLIQRSKVCTIKWNMRNRLRENTSRRGRQLQEHADVSLRFLLPLQERATVVSFHGRNPLFKAASRGMARCAAENEGRWG